MQPGSSIHRRTAVALYDELRRAFDCCRYMLPVGSTAEQFRVHRLHRWVARSNMPYALFLMGEPAAVVEAAMRDVRDIRREVASAGDLTHDELRRSDEHMERLLLRIRSS